MGSAPQCPSFTLSRSQTIRYIANKKDVPILPDLSVCATGLEALHCSTLLVYTLQFVLSFQFHESVFRLLHDMAQFGGFLCRTPVAICSLVVLFLIIVSGSMSEM